MATAAPFSSGVPKLVMDALRKLCDESLEKGLNLDPEEVSNLGVELETAFSLRAHILSRHIKKTSHVVRAAMPSYAAAWQAGGPGNDVVSLARRAK